MVQGANQESIILERISQSETTDAGISAQFQVWLDQAPTSDVTVPVASGDESEASVDPTSLAFTPANWSERQTATLSGANDCSADGDVAFAIEVGPALSTAPAFNGVDPDDLMYTTLDNDPPSSHPPLAVCNYELIDKRRATRFEYDYTFRVELTNAGATAENIRATVSATSAYSTLLDDQIDFAIAGAGETVMSA